MTTPYAQADEYLGRIGIIGVNEIYSSLKIKSVTDARTIFNKHKSWYHPIVVDLVTRTLA